MSNSMSLTAVAALFVVHPATVRRWTMRPDSDFPKPRRRPDGHLEFDAAAIAAAYQKRKKEAA